jgi:ribosomal protein S4E
MNEQKYKIIYDYLDNLTFPKEVKTEAEKEKLKKLSEKYFIQHQQLFRKTNEGDSQRVILPEQTEIVLFNLHKDQSGAHLGSDATYEKLKERYYWPKMYESV